MRVSIAHNGQGERFVASGEPEHAVGLRCNGWLSRQVCQQSRIDPDTELTLRLIRVVLDSAVRQDFHAGVLVKNLAALMQQRQQEAIDRQTRHRQGRWKANFTQSVLRTISAGADIRPGL